MVIHLFFPTFEGPLIKLYIYMYVCVCIIIRVIVQAQTILQHFYKMLMWPTSYWFLSWLTINIIFSFINNHSPYQQFVKNFVK